MVPFGEALQRRRRKVASLVYGHVVQEDLAGSRGVEVACARPIHPPSADTVARRLWSSDDDCVRHPREP